MGLRARRGGGAHLAAVRAARVVGGRADSTIPEATSLRAANVRAAIFDYAEVAVLARADQTVATLLSG